MSGIGTGIIDIILEYPEIQETNTGRYFLDISDQRLMLILSYFVYIICFHISATVSWWVTHSPRKTEDVCSNSGIGRHIVARMTA